MTKLTEPDLQERAHQALDGFNRWVRISSAAPGVAELVITAEPASVPPWDKPLYDKLPSRLWERLAGAAAIGFTAPAGATDDPVRLLLNGKPVQLIDIPWTRLPRLELLNSRRWKVRYSYACADPAGCWGDHGRHEVTSGHFLNCGEQHAGAETAAALVANAFGDRDIADVQMWQESEEECAARLKRDRAEAADARRGVWWGMGGAN